MNLTQKIINSVDDEKLASLLSEFIKIPSPNPPGNNEAITKKIKEEMEDIGLDNICIYQKKEGFQNIVGELGNGNGPKLILYAHSDVVPIREKNKWKVDPLGGIIKDNKVWGRGAADTKSGLTSMLGAARALKECGVELNGKLQIIAFADGEKGDVNGAEYMAEEELLNGDMVISIEPTGYRIVRKFMGRVWLKIRIEGEAVHASLPDEGINAIDKVTKIIDRIKQYKLNYESDPDLGESTTAFTTIQGGSVPNATAGYCEITFDVRLVPGQTYNGVFEEYQKLLNEMENEDSDLNTTLSIIPTGRDPLETCDENFEGIKIASEAFKEVDGNDVEFFGGIESPGALSYFKEVGINGISFGPGNIRNAHLPNEFVEIKHVGNIARIHALIATKFCGVK